MWNDGPAAVTVLIYVHGYDESAITEEQLADIEAEWIAQKPLNAFYWSSEYEDLCRASRTAPYGSPTPGRAAMPRLSPQATRSPTRLRGGPQLVGGLYDIIARTENYDLALEFLDLKVAELSLAGVTR